MEASASAVWYTNWRRNIASVNWGMGAWTRIGLKATIIVVSSCVRKHSAWSWSTTLQSVGTVAPLRYYRARNLGYVWCTASGSSIKPEGPGVQAICALPCTR